MAWTLCSNVAQPLADPMACCSYGVGFGAIAAGGVAGRHQLLGGLKRRCRQEAVPFRKTGRRSFFGMNLGDLLPSNGTRWTAAAWVDNSAQVDVNVPLAYAWDLWSDRENVNRWMPWISSVKVLKDQPELSRWTLRYEAFGQNLEFSWLALNMQPIHHQKIHWRSVDGHPNKGAVRFYPSGPASCRVQLTISYEIPEVLAAFASSLSPLVESILRADLERFATFAGENVKRQ